MPAGVGVAEASGQSGCHPQDPAVAEVVLPRVLLHRQRQPHLEVGHRAARHAPAVRAESQRGRQLRFEVGDEVVDRPRDLLVGRFGEVRQRQREGDPLCARGAEVAPRPGTVGWRQGDRGDLQAAVQHRQQRLREQDQQGNDDGRQVAAAGDAGIAEQCVPEVLVDECPGIQDQLTELLPVESRRTLHRGHDDSAERQERRDPRCALLQHPHQHRAVGIGAAERVARQLVQRRGPAVDRARPRRGVTRLAHAVRFCQHVVDVRPRGNGVRRDESERGSGWFRREQSGPRRPRSC